MIESDLYLIVIAGGSGTRFWPKSTSKRPKQLLSFAPTPSSLSNTHSRIQSSSLLAQTFARFEGWVPENQNHQIVVTTQSLRPPIQEECPNVEVLAEPQGRNTAPCVYWAARRVAEQNPKGIMLVMPADHAIADVPAFIATAQSAAKWARENDDLVTLGIHPTRPETGYGYLKIASDMRHVQSFVEKPSLEKAQQFLTSGNYLWNGGMFLWRAETILAAFDLEMPEMKQAWDRARGKVEDAYPAMTATSIDYGVMEKAKNVVTFSLDCGWDDLGSWTSLENLPQSLGAKQGANIVTQGEVVAIDAVHNIVDAPQKLVALLGVEDLIVVEHGSAILVAHKSRAQDIKRVVEEVKKVRPDLV